MNSRGKLSRRPGGDVSVDAGRQELLVHDAGGHGPTGHAEAGLQKDGNTLRYVSFHDDYPVMRLTAHWRDAAPATEMRYVVETSPLVVQRCMLMATAPGDLVFDPTCGSGTTAYVAEQWGRRWITCDSSRVAVTLARLRAMTAIRSTTSRWLTQAEGVSSGFQYKTVPHITLGLLPMTNRGRTR